MTEEVPKVHRSVDVFENILVMCLVVESKTLLALFFLFYGQCCIISAGRFGYNIHASLRHTHHTNKVQKCHFPQLEHSLRGLAVTIKGSTPKTLVGRSCLMALISAGEAELQLPASDSTCQSGHMLHTQL